MARGEEVMAGRSGVERGSSTAGGMDSTRRAFAFTPLGRIGQSQDVVTLNTAVAARKMRCCAVRVY